MALKNIELGAHHTPRLENDDGAGDESGVVDEDLEKGRITVVEAVKVDALDEDDSADEARGGLVFVPVNGKCQSMIERGLEFCNVAVDYFRSFNIHGPLVSCYDRPSAKVANIPESGSSDPAYSI